jgi:hypothetical protein
MHVLLKPVLPQELHVLVERLLHREDVTSAPQSGLKKAPRGEALGQTRFGMTG